MTKFATVVVTYFPSDACIADIEKMASYCGRLIIIDNTPIEASVNLPKSGNIKVHKLNDNYGLATALNIGLQLAGKEQYENIFLLDQDSRPFESFFKEMLKFKAEIDVLISNCALYVPNFYDRNSKTFAKFPSLTRFSLKHTACDVMQSGPCSRTTIAITSGTLINYTKYQKIGPLKDEYFIDFIDNEYCLRLYKLGYRLAINCNVTLDHAIGARIVRKFIGFTIKPNFHSALRRYYIARNGVRTSLAYAYHYPSYIPLILARMIHELFSIILFENCKYTKIKAMIYGIYHGFIGRMGKCQVESFISNAG
jgi:rhamnosyltransferase